MFPIRQVLAEALRSFPPSSRRRYLQRLFAIETARASLQQQLATAQAEAEEAAAEHTALEEGAKAGEKEKARAARRMTELERKLASLQQKARGPPPRAPALPAPVRTARHVPHRRHRHVAGGAREPGGDQASRRDPPRDQAQGDADQVAREGARSRRDRERSPRGSDTWRVCCR